MKAVISTFGTRGDFEPFIALAQELTDHGHEVVFAIPDFAEPELQKTGFERKIIATEIPDLRNEVNLVWSTQSDAYFSGTSALESLSSLRKTFPQIVTALSEICSNASVLISGPAQPLARVVHDLSGIPFVSVHVSHFGGTGGPALVDIGDKLINGFRREAGLAPIRDPLTIGANSPQLALYAMSSHVIRQPAEWPRHHSMTGFFYRPRYPQLEPDLEDFLNSGPPPVAISLGSMPHTDIDSLKQMFIEATRLSKSRAVIQGMAKTSSLPEEWDGEIYWAGSVAHARLFPRCACVVTHGGAGTSAAVFRAGVPGVYVPHGDIYDQRYWAQLAQEMLCSVGAIAFSALDSSSLASAIQVSCSNPALRENAFALSQKIARERGVQTARQLIETLVSQLGFDD